MSPPDFFELLSCEIGLTEPDAADATPVVLIY